MSATQKLLRFGVFELNLDTEELRKSDTVVKLPPQPLKLLALLANHAGQVVSRDQIQRKLWDEDSEVDVEHVVNKCIKQIRNVLGDNADKPLYIETLPRQGYRFVAPVVSKVIPAPRPMVVESDSGERGPVAALIGSGTGAPVAAVVVAPEYSAAMTDAEVARLAPEVSFSGKLPLRFRRNRLLWVGAAVLMAALIGGGLYWRARRARANALTEKDTIVLADFENKTGDTVFDSTLRQGLSAQLEQSPFLNLLSDDRIGQTLSLMAQAKDTRLTGALAREVCQRTASAATIEGSIAKLGSQYVLGLKAVNCRNGDLLADEVATANGKEQVVKALGESATKLRTKLGESLASVQKYDAPPEDVTTASLDALQAYSLGRKMQLTKGDSAALPFYKRAVELDPNFAMAYRAMSVVYGNLGEPSRAAENARKAYELRKKASERERFSIEANYYLSATGELDKAAQTYELWQQIYPRDYLSYTNSSFIYSSLGNGEKALEEGREAIRLEPNSGTNYGNLGADYVSLNRLDEAESVYKQAEERKLNTEQLLVNRYKLAFLKGDTAQMAPLALAAMGRPGTEDMLLASQADTEAWYGKLNSARELTRRAMDSAQRNDAKETAAAYRAAAALREVESGNREQARTDADAAVKLARNRDVWAMAALALARAGDTAGAEKLAAELDNTFPLDTLVQRYDLPTIRAAVALQRKDPNRAVELLRVASTIDLGQPTSLNVFLYPAYLRGEAYLMLRDSGAAASQFQQFIDRYGLVVNFPLGALARLGLARAYALDAAKDPAARDKARTAYQDFLTLWKGADPDIPIYQQAKAEYAKIR